MEYYATVQKSKEDTYEPIVVSSDILSEHHSAKCRVCYFLCKKKRDNWNIMYLLIFAGKKGKDKPDGNGENGVGRDRIKSDSRTLTKFHFLSTKINKNSDRL